LIRAPDRHAFGTIGESVLSFDYDTVPGDYQYRALSSRHPMQRFWHAGKLRVIDQLIRPHMKQGSYLLEIGCGAGNLLLHATVGGSYPVALDLAMASLMFVRSRLQESRFGPDAPGGFACMQALSEMLPLADGSFDCVLLSEVIEHLESPDLTIREVARVLRPGGRLLVTTPNYRSLWPAMEWAVDLLGMAPKMAGEQHITRFHAQALRQLLLEAGLRIQHFGTIYSLSPFLALASPAWASRRLAREIANNSSLGMILVAVASKP
jgi:2-polyprenyl-3-methyl-5-hydroxy-6-metoxy-1,4-benzoquinol methylase